MKPTKLQLEIHGQNELKKLAKHVLTTLIPLLKPFLNQKLFTADGLSAKAKKTIDLQTIMKSVNLDPLLKGHFCKAHICFIENSYNSLRLKLSICLNGGSYDVTPNTAYCQYFDQTFYIGKTSEKDYTILTELTNIDKLIAEYELNMLTSVEREILLINQWKELKEQVEKIEKKISIPKDVYKYM